MDVLGFTGTRLGMTVNQRKTLNHILISERMTKFLNGCARGADREAANIMSLYQKVWIEFQPGNREQLNWAHQWKREYNRQNCIVHQIEPYLVRNRLIATACDHLVATPAQWSEILRSGTWATIRYAKQAGKKVTIIRPDGSVEVTEGGNNGKRQSQPDPS